MSRNIRILAVLLLLSQGLGCAMCACPYDYTGPVPADGMGFNERAGSVLNGQINEAFWDGEVSQDAMGETIVDPGSSGGMPDGIPQGEPVLAPQPEGDFGPQSRMPTPRPQARPVVHPAH